MPNNLVSNATARAWPAGPLGFQPAGLDRVVPVLLIDDALPVRRARNAIWAEAFGRIDRFQREATDDRRRRPAIPTVPCAPPGLIETSPTGARALPPSNPGSGRELDRAMAAFGPGTPEPDGR